jgi:hypothetical protein
MAIDEMHKKNEKIVLDWVPKTRAYLSTAKLYVKPRWELEAFVEMYPDFLEGSADKYKLSMLAKIFNKTIPQRSDSTESGKKSGGRMYYNNLSKKHMEFKGVEEVVEDVS